MKGLGLTGARVSLRTLLPEDERRLYAEELSESLGSRWRLGGATPSPRQHSASLWANVLAQYAIVKTRQPAEFVGVTAAYDADHRNGHAWIAVAAVAAYQGSGLAIGGAGLFIDYMFHEWPFRRLYAESMEFSIRAFSHASPAHLQVVGRLKDDRWHDGRFHDRLILQIERTTWEAGMGKELADRRRRMEERSAPG